MTRLRRGKRGSRHYCRSLLCSTFTCRGPPVLAPLGEEDTDAPDNDVEDDEDEPLQEFRRCLPAMASGKTVKKLRAWRTTYYALKDSRKQGSMKGMTRILNGKQEQGIPMIVPGCPMLTATRYDFKVPLHRFKTLLT